MAASFFLLLAFVSLFSPIEAANNNGFSMALIHRDSPESPFYNPSETPSQRVQNALQRSFGRVHRFNLNPATSSSPNTPVGYILAANGEYLMNVSIGVPSFQILAIADTGSDLTWTQCKGCTTCFPQKSPMFDPQHSDSYVKVYCKTAICSQTAEGGKCGDDDNICHYHVRYGDDSESEGILSIETLTFDTTAGLTVLIPRIIFGCGYNNKGTFGETGSGIIGLGGGVGSLIFQMGKYIEWKFSYCLVVPLNGLLASSKINFGSNALVSGQGVVSTPLISKQPKTFYFLNLEAISVGIERIEFYGPHDNVTYGNIIIDSGTTLTLLPRDLYNRLKGVVIEQVKVPRRVMSLDLCYISETSFETPDMTVHFTGADVKLNFFNAFIRISTSIICFAFVPTDSLAIYGNLAQMNFLVGYDVDQWTVSFKPSDCTQQ